MNLRHLTELLACSPNMKVQLRFGYVWGQNGRYLGPGMYHNIMNSGVERVRLKGVDMDVHIRTHPKFLDEWVDLLVRTAPRAMFSHFVFGLAFVEGMSSLMYAIALGPAPIVGGIPGHRYFNNSQDQSIFSSTSHTTGSLTPFIRIRHFHQSNAHEMYTPLTSILTEPRVRGQMVARSNVPTRIGHTRTSFFRYY